MVGISTQIVIKLLKKGQNYQNIFMEFKNILYVDYFLSLVVPINDDQAEPQLLMAVEF